jgi:hypothetical protein
MSQKHCNKYHVKFCLTKAKFYAPMNTKWQKMLYLICCVNFFLTECNGFLGRFTLH